MESTPPNDPAGLADECDVVIVGGGVNGLVCAVLLARSGLSVQVLEDKPAVGGMHRTEYPFAKAPRLATFTGAHRVGFVPKELVTQLALPLPLAPREPSMFVPTTTAGRYLLAGAGNEGLQHAAGGLLSEPDSQALGAMFAELDALVSDLEPAWTAAAMPVEEVGDRYVRSALRESFVTLCRGTFAEYAARFGIQSGLVKAALAADALGGSFASSDTPGSGGPLLIRHAARSIAGGGDAVAVGGLGALARTLADHAQTAGASVVTGALVRQILVEGNTASGVVLANGRTIRTGAVVTSADPWRLRALVGADRLPAEYNRRVEGFSRPGGIAKLLVALSELPRFACVGDAQGQHRATTFLLPGDEDDAVRALGRAFADASAWRLPAETPLECVFPTATDESLRDPDGHHSASFLIPWAPYDLAGTTWAAEEERFTSSILDMLERFAPGARSLVTDSVLYPPKKIEAHFGITRGHVGHADDTLLFGDRLPATTPISGLYTCGRACAPAGGVFGVAGLNASRRVLADFELALERTELGIRECPLESAGQSRA
jgi:phytoene dehydrogenase-like protein